MCGAEELFLIKSFLKVYITKPKHISAPFNPIPYGLFNKPNLMGGQICPPLVVWPSEAIFNILFKQGSCLGCKL